MSIYHATVKKNCRGDWEYSVFEDWESSRPVLIVRGTFRTWIESFAQAAGLVSTYRSMYERP